MPRPLCRSADVKDYLEDPLEEFGAAPDDYFHKKNLLCIIS